MCACVLSAWMYARMSELTHTQACQACLSTSGGGEAGWGGVGKGPMSTRVTEEWAGFFSFLVV